MSAATAVRQHIRKINPSKWAAAQQLLRSCPLNSCRMILKQSISTVRCRNFLIFRNVHAISTCIHTCGVWALFLSGGNFSRFHRFYAHWFWNTLFWRTSVNQIAFFESYAKFWHVSIPVVPLYHVFSIDLSPDKAPLVLKKCWGTFKMYHNR